MLAHILIWFLASGQGSEVYLTLTTGCLGVALQSSAAHTFFINKLNQSASPKESDRATDRSQCVCTNPKRMVRGFGWVDCGSIFIHWPADLRLTDSDFFKPQVKLQQGTSRLVKAAFELILTWRGSKAWSRRGFFQSEALALHFAWADLCDCYKCSNSTV